MCSHCLLHTLERPVAVAEHLAGAMRGLCKTKFAEARRSRTSRTPLPIIGGYWHLGGWGGGDCGN
jgi:hypothetical protein